MAEGIFDGSLMNGADLVEVTRVTPVDKNGQVAGDSQILVHPEKDEYPQIPYSAAEMLVKNCGKNYKEIATTRLVQLPESFSVFDGSEAIIGQPGDYLGFEDGLPFIVEKDRVDSRYRRVTREIRPKVQRTAETMLDGSDGRGFAETP